MGRYFTDEVIDAVIKKWEETYPGAIERAHDVMKHPFRDNEETVIRHMREFSQVFSSVPFLADRARQNPNFEIEITFDVFDRIGEMLGPLGTRSISD